jgi:hypothetical protein
MMTESVRWVTADGSGGNVATSLGRRAGIAAAVSVVVTAAALTIALMAAAGNREQGRELSGRLVPAARAAVGLGNLYTAESGALRDYVTSGRAASLMEFRDAAAAVPAQLARVARLGRGYRPVPPGVAAAGSALAAWRARVAGPQLAAARRGDFPAARALQADIARTRPYSLAVRAKVAGLQARINDQQAMAAGHLITGQRALLWALVAVCALVALIAAGGVVAVRRWLLVPFRSLRAAADSVAAGRYDTRVPAPGPAELAALGRSAEQMRARLVTALDGAEEAENKFRRLFDAAPDALLTVREDGTIVMANVQAERMFGYGPGELGGQRAALVLPAAADAPASYLADLGPDPVTGRTTTAAGRDGREFPVEATVTTLPSGTGNGLTGLISLRDITERLAAQAETDRLRAEADAERYQRRLEQSQRLESLGQLVGGVAHDFNNILNIITGYASLLAEQLADPDPADPDERDSALTYIGQVQDAAQRAVSLTRQLLAFARRDVTRPQVLDLNAVIGGVEHMLRRTLGEQVELVTAPAPDLWPVLADPGQLGQVLVNLAVNASDAMPGGGKLTIDTASITVDDAYASARPGLAPGRYARIRVSDTGTGMDADTAARVFEPFYTTKPAGKGTGLGLAAVHGIITGAGGHAALYSEPGLGTTITLLLPATGHAPGTGTAPAPQAPAAAGGSGETILVAEDEDALAALVHRILTRNGYRVDAATTPRDALARASDLDRHIDLLLTDAVMPGMLGNEVAARVQALRPGLPVLYMSGYAQPVLDTHGALDPHIDLLEKPFSETTLLTRIRHALDNNTQQPGTR